MTLADFTAAAHLSCLDYISDVDWNRLGHGQGLVCQDQVAPLLPAACWPIRCRAFRRPRIMPTWISEPARAGGFCPRTARGYFAETEAGMSDGTEGAAGARALGGGVCQVGVCAPDAVPEAAGRLAAWLAAGHHGQMGWMAERAEWRGSAAALWPEARSVIMLAEVYTPEADPLAVLDAARPGGGQCLCAGQGLPRSGQAAAEAAGALADRGGGGRDQGVRRYRAGDGKAAGAGGGAGLAGQAHEPAEPRSGQLVLPGCDLHHAGAAARCAGGRALRNLHGLPRHLPDAGLSGALPARCAALHFLPDHRASRAGGRGAARR